MSKGMRFGVVWAATAAVSMVGVVEPAQAATDEHVQSHALRYAGMIERAYGRLNGFIRHGSTGVVSWRGAAVPPASTGWEAVWTEAGLRARYCDNVLLVYFAPAQAKGVGGAHRAIQQARRSFLPERARGVRLPMLAWLEAGEVIDAHGGNRTLDACMTAHYTEALPSGRAALAGDVVDPWTVVSERESYEERAAPCPSGKHGAQRWRRSVTQEVNKDDVPVGPPVHEAWKRAPGSWCREDYTYYEVFARACSWYQGEPFNRDMEGTETWRVPISVSADPDEPVGGTRKITGTPEFVSTTCWDTLHGPVPVPTTTVDTVTERRTLNCGAGFSGTITESRTKTSATTTYPWDETQLVSVEYTNWSETSNNCTTNNDCDSCGGGRDDFDGGFDDGDGGMEDAPPDYGRDKGSYMGPDAISGRADDGLSDAGSVDSYDRGTYGP